MRKPRIDGRKRIMVSIDELLLDEVEVECEILAVSRSLAVEAGLRVWLAQVRKRQLG